MKKENILDNYHYTSTILALAATNNCFTIIRYLPSSDFKSAFFVTSDDKEINIPLPLRKSQTEKTSYQKDAYKIAEYVFNKQQKSKQPATITNDKELFERVVDIINKRLENEEKIEKMLSPKELATQVENFKIPHSMLFELFSDSKKNFMPISRELTALATANNIVGQLFCSDLDFTITVSDYKDVIHKTLKNFCISDEDVEKMFAQTQNSSKQKQPE